METSQILVTPVRQAMIRIAGYEVLAICLANGSIGAGVRMICDLLGVDRPGQMRKLQSDPAFRDSLVLAKVEIAGEKRAVHFIIAEFIPLWLKEIHPSKVAPEARETLAEFQRVAVQTLRAFFFPESKAQQQFVPPKAPEPAPLPPPDETALSVYDMHRSLVSRMEQEDQQLETRLAEVELENQQLRVRLSSVEQENQRLQAMLTARDRQQMDVVAWMAEKGHELSVQAEQLHALTTWAEQLAASRARQSEQPGEARPPMPGPARLHALQTMPYQEYLQTPEWKATREAALKRALYRCQVCNTNETSLHAHHRTYERLGCEQPEDVFVLCETCHGRAHPHASAKRHKPAGNTSPSDSEPEAFFPPFPDYAI